MMKFKRNTLAFKTTLFYIVVTLINITVFIAMVFENQLDLITENTVLNSEMKGTSLKFRTDNIIGPLNEIDKNVLNKILKEAKFLGINEITVFEENGTILVEVKEGKFSSRKTAESYEIEWINKGITRSGFEDKIFTHKIRRKDKIIELYVPVNFGVDKIIVLRPLMYMKDIDKQMGYLYKQCVSIGIILLLIHIGINIFFSRLILRPLAKLNEATYKISRGDLENRVEIIRDDEIGQLAISFNEMTVALSRMQDEAKGANPLTGLPGNRSIASQIDMRLKNNDKFAVLYCDLDNFKAYNDKYGFSKGDQVILFSKDSLVEAGKKKGDDKTFVGHEGGDDFVIIASIPTWEEIAKALISNLDYGISAFYNETDAKRRYIESVNRQGIPMRFPLVSISVAVVSNDRRTFANHVEMVSVATEMKKFVKGKEGSCYAIDRRTDPPPKGYDKKPWPPEKPLPQGPFPPGVKMEPEFNKNVNNKPGPNVTNSSASAPKQA
jgi:diguanylate cyclase (GGDEF)-like protein